LLSLCLCIPSHNIFVFYEIRVVSKENKRSVLHRTSYYYLIATPTNNWSYKFISASLSCFLITIYNFSLCLKEHVLFVPRIYILTSFSPAPICLPTDIPNPHTPARDCLLHMGKIACLLLPLAPFNVQTPVSHDTVSLLASPVHCSI
jgi:hypothetical protein